MAEYINEEPKIRFTIPDDITVLKQMEYSSQMASIIKKNRALNLWLAAKLLIDEWECELIPDHELADLAEMTDPTQALVIAWVSGTAWDHIAGLEQIPKN